MPEIAFIGYVDGSIEIDGKIYKHIYDGLCEDCALHHVDDCGPYPCGNGNFIEVE